MTALIAFRWFTAPEAAPARQTPPKSDWPLMSDVSTIRAGVPEALIHWRAARGETPPAPSDPDLLRRQNSL